MSIGKIVLKKTGMEETAQSGRRLPHQQEDPSLIPRSHVKKREKKKKEKAGTKAHIYDPSAGEIEMALLASQTSQLASSSEPTERLSQKGRCWHMPSVPAFGRHR